MNNTDTPGLKFTFGYFIKSARIEKNMTQREVAEKAKIEQAYLSKIERGVREPTLNVALRLCSVLNLDINDFVYQSI